MDKLPKIQYDFFEKRERTEKEAGEKEEQEKIGEALSERYGSDKGKIEEKNNIAGKIAEIRAKIGLPPKVPEEKGQKKIF